MFGLQSALISRQKVSGIGFNDVCQAGYLTALQVTAKPLIKVLMRSVV